MTDRDDGSCGETAIRQCGEGMDERGGELGTSSSVSLQDRERGPRSGRSAWLDSRFRSSPLPTARAQRSTPGPRPPSMPETEPVEQDRLRDGRNDGGRRPGPRCSMPRRSSPDPQLVGDRRMPRPSVMSMRSPAWVLSDRPITWPSSCSSTVKRSTSPAAGLPGPATASPPGPVRPNADSSRGSRHVPVVARGGLVDRDRARGFQAQDARAQVADLDRHALELVARRPHPGPPPARRRSPPAARLAPAFA